MHNLDQTAIKFSRSVLYELRTEVSPISPNQGCIRQLPHILTFPGAMKATHLYVVYGSLIDCNFGLRKWEYVLLKQYQDKGFKMGTAFVFSKLMKVWNYIIFSNWNTVYNALRMGGTGCWKQIFAPRGPKRLIWLCS